MYAQSMHLHDLKSPPFARPPFAVLRYLVLLLIEMELVGVTLDLNKRYPPSIKLGFNA